MRGEVDGVRLRVNPQSFLLVQPVEPFDRLARLVAHAAVLIEGALRHERVPDHGAAALSRHRLGVVHIASHLGDAASQFAHGARERGEIALAHEIGHHRGAVVVKLNIVDIAENLRADAAAADFHAFDSRSHICCNSSSVAGRFLASSVPTT